jgi:hypothetical protein
MSIPHVLCVSRRAGGPEYRHHRPGERLGTNLLLRSVFAIELHPRPPKSVSTKQLLCLVR